jgi:hypothetical protein
MTNQVMEEIQEQNFMRPVKGRARRRRRINIPDEKFYDFLLLLEHYKNVPHLAHINKYPATDLYRIIKLRKYTYRDIDTYDHEVVGMVREFYEDLLNLVHTGEIVQDEDLIYNLHFTLRLHCIHLIHLKKVTIPMKKKSVVRWGPLSGLPLTPLTREKHLQI